MDSMDEDDELNPFDWEANENTATGRVARRVLNWAISAKAKGSFGKSEYDKALNLICIFLGHHVRCKIPRPGNVRIKRDKMRIFTLTVVLDIKGPFSPSGRLLPLNVPSLED